jgi:ABC-2 type transport system permease protein
VWFRSIFLKTLRDCRIAILGWGLGIGVLTPLIFVVVPTLLDDIGSRAEVLALVRHPAMRLFAEPVDVLSPGGYATWRLSLLLPLVGIWALLAMSRTLRGEEESGALDVLLSVPRSRLRVATEKLAAVAASLLLMGALIALMAFAGGKIAHTGLRLEAAVLFGLNAALLAGVFGATALLASQFTRARRTAAGITGAFLGLSVVMTSVGRTVPGGGWVGQLSPLHYFELSKPLVASYGTSPRAMLALAALSAALSAVGLALFVRRDVGAHVALPARRDRADRQAGVRAVPLSGWSLRSDLGRSLASLSATTSWWGLALAIYTAVITAILRQTQENLLGLLESAARRGPVYADLVARFTGGDDAAMNARFLTPVFMLLAVVVAAFAVTLASHWAAEEEEGRLELLLGTPRARQLVILARFAAAAAALLMVCGLIFASVTLTSSLVGFALDKNRLAQAAFGIVPIGLVVTAIGYLLSGWLRSRAVSGILIALLLASFVITLLGSLWRWPPLLLQLSIFEQYGTPLVDGLRPGNTLGLFIVAAAALTAATIRFGRKDLTR